jgi:cell wall-associated NlpC family hydrolase
MDSQRPKSKAYRLRFTDEERADPELAPHIRKAEKATDKLEKAQAKIPKKKGLKKERVFDEVKAKPKTRLYFEETDKPKPPSKLTHAVLSAPALEAHRQISKVEDENVGVQAAHKSEQAAETGVRAVNSIHRSRKLKPYRTAATLEKKADQANINALYQKAIRQNPELQSNPLSRWQQKQAIKRQYAAAKKARQTAGTTKKTAEKAAKTAKKAAEAAEKTAAFVVRNWKPILIIAAIAVLLVLIMNAVSSCSMLLQGGINMVVGTSYTAEDEDILAAEAYYTGLESGLRQKIGKIETTHPGYDEYRYNLAEIGHDPFELMSYLTALYEDFTIAKARPALDTLFNRQYKLTVTETVETRYRTETRTGSYTTTDPDTGETETHYYTYEVEVPYSYYILNVTLTNNALSRIAAADLDTEKLELYAVYMETQGNKPYLFEGNIYAHPGPFTDYEIPPAALADANFAALIREAEKYLGYPYVWGGSNPSESFDCSGFVCWVLDHSGVYPIGRTNAQGIFNKTTPIAPSEAKPGDIIFFTGTYDSSGPVSHVGIYVGDNMMIHCASGGVQYARMDTKYWTQHFYAFGRLPL